MIPVVLLAATVVFSIASIAASLFGLWRSQVMVLAAEDRARSGIEECERNNHALRREVAEMAAQLRDLGNQAPAGLTPQASLNLSKRSQALRLHRKGDDPGQIASALGVPRQEVNLLIKVHRIVIGKI